ncbi:MAG: SpoIIE family protein phosphatase [Anaerolineae bacterium]|nr:SpoIIE family protein phosphatase [Anaerolineae bacterium]
MAERDMPKGDILIVDDTPANLRLLAQILHEHGYRARPVPEGALALAAVHAQPPDLILLDIRMPGMTGYEVCERLKAEASTRGIPIIFLSALDATQDKIKAFAAGGVDYVTKPFQVEEVLARIETHLSLRRLQRQLQEANERMARELSLAGQVQASFLPRGLPHIAGWDLAMTLRPASETSGDYYDVIPLEGGRLGILVADVVDKGVAAALYMALTWGLIRTYAAEQPGRPAQVLQAVNRRLLADTGASQFVTVFYGVIELASGSLTYCNAGHCPPYLLLSGDAGPPRPLGRTGVPLGILEEECQEKAVELAPGDALVLYTDGIIEAQNDEQGPYGEQRLLRMVTARLALPAQQIVAELMDDVLAFAGGGPKDDMTLALLRRGLSSPSG